MWAQPYLKDNRADKVVYISAATGQGLDTLDAAITDILNRDKVKLERILPFTHSNLLDRIHKEGQVLSEEYTENGIMVCAYIPAHLAQYIDKEL